MGVNVNGINRPSLPIHGHLESSIDAMHLDLPEAPVDFDLVLHHYRSPMRRASDFQRPPDRPAPSFESEAADSSAGNMTA